MYAECPNCHAIFRVTEEILSKAGGKVRCGECSHIFNVKEGNGETLNAPGDDIDAAVNESDTPSSRAEIEPAIPAQPRPNGLPSTFIPDSESPDMQAPDAEASDEDFELIIEERDESELHPEAKRGLNALWAVVGAFLGMLLLAQVLVAYRNTIVTTVPALRPLVSGLCSLSGCVVDPRRDVKKIALVQHSIFSHPASDDALMIRGEMVNKADFAQPYPVIELKLSNIQGKPVALRRFGPDEYLGSAKPVPPMMPVGQPVPIHLEVLDPGKNALAFEFDFL